MSRRPERRELQHRVTKFCLVGGLGIGVQLLVLEALVAAKMGYLSATALAVESAVLHNFLWHQRFTWADRPVPGLAAIVSRLLSFHLSSGLISLLGNLLVMRWLVGYAHASVLLANLLAISSCFAANFLASEFWIFAVGNERLSLPLSGKHARAIPHQDQRSLGERDVDECGGAGQRQSYPDLGSEQERRQGPKLIDDERCRKQTLKLAAQIFYIE